MIIALVGESGSGKSTIENKLHSEFGFEKIVSFTTRDLRDGEVNGVDYHFISNDTFQLSKKKGVFAELEEYSFNRFYGTIKTSYTGDKVVVLTPNGVRQVKKAMPQLDIVVVYVTAKLKTRALRYINRCSKFTYDDMNELNSRVERDFGMFKGFEAEADIVIENENYNDIYTTIYKIQDTIKTKETLRYTE